MLPMTHNETATSNAGISRIGSRPPSGSTYDFLTLRSWSMRRGEGWRSGLRLLRTRDRLCSRSLLAGQRLHLLTQRHRGAKAQRAGLGGPSVVLKLIGE